MTNDIQIIENFIIAYFKSEKTNVYYKIHQISKIQSQSQKFYKFIKKILKKLIKKRINVILTDELYKEHFWFMKMVDLFSKIFRDTKKMHKIEKLVKTTFGQKVISLKSELILRTTSDFFSNNFLEISHFLIINDFYSINFKEELENEIIKKFVEDMRDNEVSDIKRIIDNINDDQLKIKDRILTEISKDISEYKILKCLQDKENIEFLFLLFIKEKDKYIEIIMSYLNEKYDLESLKNNLVDEEYVINILYMYKEYKVFDDFIKSVFYTAFKDINLQYEKFVKIINLHLENSISDSEFTNTFELFEFSGFLYYLINDKDIYEKELRKALCRRLINKLSKIEDEEEFIKTYKIYAKDVYVYKMVDVLEDYKKRIIFNNLEIMMMRKFQWVDFENSEVLIDELDELKKKYVDQIAKYERKKIIWMDSLSSVEVEIHNKDIILNLIQYKILLNIDNAEFLTNLNEEYKTNLQILIDKGLLICHEGSFIINLNCDTTDFNVQEHILIENKPSSDNFNKKEYGSEVLDSRIMLRLKKYKTLKISQLYDISDYLRISERLNILEKKGYCKIEDDIIKYCP